MFNNLLCNHNAEDITLIIYDEKFSDEFYFPVQIFHYCNKCGKFVDIGDINRFEVFSNPVIIIGSVGIAFIVICAGTYLPLMLFLVVCCYVIAELFIN